MKKIGLLILILLAALCSFILMGILWPLEKISPPLAHETILIHSVNVVDLDSGRILSNRSILIEGKKIVKIDSGINSISKQGLLIDGSGMFAIPGLWDMHTHSNKLSPWLHHPLLIAYGVTSVRDMSGHLGKDDSYWAGTVDRKVWNNQMELGNYVGPRYPINSSYQINGPNAVPDNYPDFFRMDKSSDVPHLLKFYQEEGTDFIKVYSEIDSSVYRDLLVLVSEYGMHVAGHKPLSVSLEDAIVLGQRSFEHGRMFMYECFPLASKLRTSDDPIDFYKKHKSEMISNFDTVNATGQMSLMRMHQAHWVPTLQTLKSAAYASDADFISSSNLKFIPYVQRKLWWEPDIKSTSGYNSTEVGNGVNSQFLELSRYLVGRAHDLGVPIMAGTDMTDTYTFPGISLHDELEELVKSGLTPLEAIRAATIVPARFTGSEQLGFIKENMLADIVLISDNPLVDIRNTKSIEAVICNGNYYSSEDILELKVQTESLASSWSVNLKYLYALVKSPLIRKQLAD